MSSSRIPTFEFRSLLLPPTRVSISTIRRYLRPQCATPALHLARPAPCLAQRRSLHLYKAARAKTLLGLHKLSLFEPYDIAPPSKSGHKVTLVKVDKDGTTTTVEKDLSLQELYDNHVRPGRMLYAAESIVKRVAEKLDMLVEQDIPTLFDKYTIIKNHTYRVPADSSQKGDQFGGLRVIMLKLSSPAEHYKRLLDRSYQFIEAGKPVEFRTRFKGSFTKDEERDWAKPENRHVWPWVHDHFPHLRPDFIRKAMPEGTVFLIDPVSNGGIVQWVLAKPLHSTPPDLNRRLWNLKSSMKRSIAAGTQSQLPQELRKELKEAGSTHYSPYTGMPKSLARQKFAEGGEGYQGGAEEKRYRKFDAREDGFMVPSEQDQEMAKLRSKRILETKPKYKFGNKWQHRGSVNKPDR